HTLHLSGTNLWELKLRTGGWIDGVETTGLGLEDKSELQGNGRKLALHLHPKANQPREIVFSVRPMGAPVWVEGTRDGRPLKPADVFMPHEPAHPPAVPFKLPEIEASGENDNEPVLRVFDPPQTDQPGLYLWLRPIQGRQAIEIGKDDCERFKA